MNLIFLGLPGAGKGTQTQLLEERWNIKQLASGQVLRDAIQQKSVLGQRVKSFVEQGLLVPDEVMIQVFADLIPQYSQKNGFSLDGFPRTLRQAEALDAMFYVQGIPLDAVIWIDIPQDILLDRISGRFSCSRCNEGYHDRYKLPKQQGICDKCGSHEFNRRKDDDFSVVAQRLKLYTEQGLPVIDYYRKQDRLKHIDGNQPIETIFGKIEDFLRENQPKKDEPKASAH